MPGIRHLTRSLALAMPLLLSAAVAAAQEASVQKLIERGSLDEAVQKAEGERDNPESIYLAAQAFSKMDNGGRANEEYSRLRERGEEDWKAVGESGAALTAGNLDEAMAAATRAVSANGGNPYAHFQLGIVASRQNNSQKAAEAFGRAAEIKPDLAYAHYYAGIANQRIKRIPKMSEHLETFIRLAPDAPERDAAAAILRTLKRR
jgi:tetratricopeptide (TPR) repeat protein